MKMLKSIFIAIFLLSGVHNVYSMSIEDLGKTTVYLRRQQKHFEKKSGKQYEIWLKDPETGEEHPKLATINGTGFLTGHNGKIYLVTAAHIAREMAGDAGVGWNTAAGKSNFVSFVQLQQGIPHSRWFFHSIADIAVHPFGFSERFNHILIPEDIFLATDETISLGTKVYILGFPLGIGITDIISPLSKKAEISSGITTIDNPSLSPDLKYILLDEDLAQGYSGAPIFISPEPRLKKEALIIGGKNKLVGIISGTISDQTGGKISLVVPIFYLNDIYESNDFKEYEKKIGIVAVYVY